MSASGLNPLGQIRTVFLIDPQAIKDNADFVGGKDSTPATCDTCPDGIKYEAARGVVRFGSIDATIANMNWYESDDDSTYTEIAGLDWTADAAAVPGAGSDNLTFTSLIDLRDKKRYLQLDLTAGDGATGTYAIAFVDLARGAQVPATDTARNVSESLSV